jgi:glycosyltransferase involved in cell wall biosynthesis
MPERIPVLYLRQSSGGGGGADTVILNTALLLDSSRFFLIIAYLSKYDQTLTFTSKLKETGVTFFEFPGIKIFDMRQFTSIVKLVKKYDVRIVHCHDFKADVYGYLLKVLFPGIRFVSTIHGWIARRLRSLLYIKIDRAVLKKCDAVIAVSQNIEQTAKGYGIQKLHLIQNSIRLDRWKPGESTKSPGHFRIGFIGRISKEKGPADFVHAAKKIITQYPVCEFFVAGNGPEEGQMKTLVNQLGLGGHFHFFGHLDENRLYDLYQKLDLLLLTSYTEGIPMAVLEASAMKVPVVATNVGGVSEVITHNVNGLLAEAGDIDSIAKNVLLIINNREVAEKFAENGRRIVETNFSAGKNIKKIEDIYMQLSPESLC